MKGKGEVKGEVKGKVKGAGGLGSGEESGAGGRVWVSYGCVMRLD